MPNTTPFQQPNEDELLQLLMQYQGGALPGKTPAAQLNYYQDLTSTLGVDAVQQAGMGDSPDKTFTPSESTTRATWGSNPIFAEVFDRIDSGQDPLTAFNETKIAHEKDKNGPKWSDALDPTKLSDDALTIKKAASDYAGEQAKNTTGAKEFAAKQGSSYTAQDGSKYKNAPLGGNGIYDTASEYDLLGQPSQQDILQQYIATHPGLPRNAPAKGGRSDTFAQGGTVGIDARSMKPDRPADSGAGVSSAGQGGWQFDDPALNAQAAVDRQNYNKEAMASGKGKVDKSTLPFNGDKITNDAFKLQAQKRIDKTKTTQVRSDANTNYMRRVLALRTILGA